VITAVRDVVGGLLMVRPRKAPSVGSSVGRSVVRQPQPTSRRVDQAGSGASSSDVLRGASPVTKRIDRGCGSRPQPRSVIASASLRGGELDVETVDARSAPSVAARSGQQLGPVRGQRDSRRARTGK
jgi:hypothetical protein